MAIIPYQNWSGEGAAVKLRTPQAPDWTAKYQLAAQERRMREAERNKDEQGKAKSALEYEKKLSPITKDWAEEDVAAIRDPMLSEMRRKLIDSGGDFDNSGFWEDFDRFQQAQSMSKEWRDNIQKKQEEFSREGTADYENLDKFEQMKKGVYSLEHPTPDGKGVMGEEYRLDRVLESEDPLKEMAKVQAARNTMLSTIRKGYNTEKEIAPVLQTIYSQYPVVQGAEITLADGRTKKDFSRDIDGIKARLGEVWDASGRLREVEQRKFFEQEHKEGQTPSGFKSAKEKFIELHTPKPPTKTEITGTVKDDSIRKNLGGNKAQIGKNIFQVYIDDNGNKTYTFEGVSEAANPKRDFTTTNGQKVVGRPYQWISEAGKTPYLKIRQEVNKPYEGVVWEEHNVSYDQATSAGLQYANPYEIDQVLGLKGDEKNVSAKSTKTAPAKQTQAEWNDAWSKLKKGETMVGLNGVTYTKK